MIIDCKFITNSCTEDEFEWIFDYQYGNCFEFNSGKNNTALAKVVSEGKYDSLQMELFIGDTNLLNLASKFSGISLIIYNKSHPISSFREIILPSGSHSDISISVKVVNQYPKPYSNCEINEIGDYKPVNNDYLMYFIENKILYNQKDCYSICLQYFFAQTCECTEATFPKISNFNKCLSINQSICLVKAFESLIDSNVELECKMKCPIECNTVSYKIEKSQASFPTKTYGDLLKDDHKFKSKFSNNNLTYDLLRRSVLSFRIYFEKLSLDVTTETPSMTIVNLFSNIGGTLGLFLGMSLLSIVELIELIIFIFTI